MEEKEFPRGQLNPTILSTLLEKDKYGYEIIEEIKNKTGIEIKQPSLYSSLKRMEAQKFISSYWQDSSIGGKRHYYCLTAIGREFLEKNPVDFSIFSKSNEEPEKKINEEENIKNTFEEIGNKIQDAINTIKQEKPLFAQQDNIFSAIKEPSKEEKPEEQKIDENYKQYDLFENVKQEEKPRTTDNIERQTAYTNERQRNLHRKNSSDPYQLKHLEEDELRNEFERLKNQKLGISSQQFTSSAPKQEQEIKIEPKVENQSNIWLDRNNYINEEKNKAEREERNEEALKIHIAQNEKNNDIKDDGKFITERINVEDISKQRISPSTLNIESANYSSFLNSKACENKEEREDQEKFLQDVSEMYSKNIEKPKYDYNQSLANMEDKFKKYINNRNNPDFEYNQEHEKIIQEEVYERVKNTRNVFNSYKSLEAYFNSKGIGFYPYVKKEKSANQYVNYSFVRFIRGCIFSFYSIILALLFYFGINAVAIGKITYLVLPILAVFLTIYYAFDYFKTRKNKIIQVKESEVSPIILPVIAACAVLVIIAINLTIGFQNGNALYYFPLLIYPICLAIHIALIVPLNKLIKFFILKFREKRLNKLGNNV